MSERRLKVGVIGLGAISGAHTGAYRALPSADLVAVCDAAAEWLEYCRAQLGVARAFGDYRELLALPELDAVSVCLPTHLHAPVTMAALEAGKHVLVEKPMAMDAAEAESMAQAARRAGRVLMISHNQRFGPDVQYLKRYIDAGSLGDVYFVRTLWRRPLGMLPPPTMDRATGAYNRNWFNEAAKGGGVARDLGSHVIDIAMWLMGFPEVSDVVGRAFTQFGPAFVRGTGAIFDADDHTVGFVRFKNGAAMQVEASYGQHIDHEEIITEVFGSRGGALRAAGQPVKLFGEAAGAYTTIVPRIPDQPGSPQAEFVDAILTGRAPLVTAEQGVAVMRIIDGIRA
jgi:predicted dehydrogenase